MRGFFRPRTIEELLAEAETKANKRQLAVVNHNNRYSLVPHHILPAYHASTLAMQQVQRIFENAYQLEDGETQSISISTSRTTREYGTEMHSVNIQLSRSKSVLTYTREIR